MAHGGREMERGWTRESFFFLEKQRGFGERERERECFSVKYGQIMGLTLFKIFTKVSLSNVVWKLKTSKISFLNSMFKHPKMRKVTQTLLQTMFFFFFFWPTVFSV